MPGKLSPYEQALREGGLMLIGFLRYDHSLTVLTTDSWPVVCDDVIGLGALFCVVVGR